MAELANLPHSLTLPPPVTGKHRVSKFQELSLSKVQMATERKTLRKAGFKSRLKNVTRKVNKRSRIRAYDDGEELVDHDAPD